MDKKKLEDSEPLHESKTNEAPTCFRTCSKKANYRKIDNQLRQKLIEMVYLKDYLLKDASRILGINYSTAKTILRIFRLEKRITKKNDEAFQNKMLNDGKMFKKNISSQSVIKENSLVTVSEESDLKKKEQINFYMLFQKISESQNMIEKCYSQISKNQLMVDDIMKALRNKISTMPCQSDLQCRELNINLNLDRIQRENQGMRLFLNWRAPGL